MSQVGVPGRMAGAPAIGGNEAPVDRAGQRIAAGPGPDPTAAAPEGALSRLAEVERRLSALENGRRPIVVPPVTERGAERAERLLAVMQESLRDLADDLRDLHEQVALLVSTAARPTESAAAALAAPPAAAAVSPQTAAALARRLVAAEARIKRLEPRPRRSLRSVAVWLARLPWRVVRRIMRDSLRVVRAVSAKLLPAPAPALPAESTVAIRHVLAHRSPSTAPLLTVVLPSHGDEDRARLHAALARQTVRGHDLVDWNVQSGSFTLASADGSGTTSGSARDAVDLRKQLRSDYVCSLRAGSEALPATWLELGSVVAASEGLLFAELACHCQDGRRVYHPSAAALPGRRPSSDLTIVRRDLWNPEGEIGESQLGEFARGGPLVLGKRLRWTLEAPCVASTVEPVPEPLWTPEVRWLGDYLVSSLPSTTEVVHAVFEVREGRERSTWSEGESVVVILDRLQSGSEWWQAPAFRALSARGVELILVELGRPATATGVVPAPWAELTPIRYDLAANVAPPLQEAVLARIVARHSTRGVIAVGRADLGSGVLRRLRERLPSIRVAVWMGTGEATAPSGGVSEELRAEIDAVLVDAGGAEAVAAWLGPKRVPVCIPPAIDENLVARVTAPEHVLGVRDGLGVGRDIVLIAAVASGRPEDRVEDVASLASRLRSDPTLSLLAVGSDGDDEAWPEAITRQGLIAVHRAAPGAVLPSLLAAADVICVTAERDLSWVVALGLALGKPVVATRQAAAGLAGIGAAGLRVAGRAGDVDALAGALRELKDPAARARIDREAKAGGRLFTPAAAADVLVSALHLGC